MHLREPLQSSRFQPSCQNNPMKQLLAACVLLLVLGFLGFLYRYEIENPHLSAALTSGIATSSAACTQDAKICPDGSAVGRTGSSCSFAACPFPNVELSAASTTISFVLPEGYKINPTIKDLSAYLGSYIQSQEISPNASTTDTASVIDVYAYPIPEGKTPSSVMLANTVYGESSQQATSTAAFATVTVGNKTFYAITTERFEGTVQSAYYLYEPHAVLSFVITEKGVKNWTDPSLNTSTLPQHQALRQMLATLQVEG